MSNGKEKTKRVVYKKGEKIESFAQQFISTPIKKRNISKKFTWDYAIPSKGKDHVDVLTSDIKPRKMKAMHKKTILKVPKDLWNTPTSGPGTESPTFKERRSDKIKTKIKEGVGYGTIALGGLKTIFGHHIK